MLLARKFFIWILETLILLLQEGLNSLFKNRSVFQPHVISPNVFQPLDSWLMRTKFSLVTQQWNSSIAKKQICGLHHSEFVSSSRWTPVSPSPNYFRVTFSFFPIFSSPFKLKIDQKIRETKIIRYENYSNHMKEIVKNEGTCLVHHYEFC